MLRTALLPALFCMGGQWLPFLPISPRQIFETINSQIDTQPFEFSRAGWHFLLSVVFVRVLLPAIMIGRRTPAGAPVKTVTADVKAKVQLHPYALVTLRFSMGRDML